MPQRIMLAKKSYPKLSLKHRCALLGVARSSLYYRGSANKDEPGLLKLIEQIWLNYPFYGYRKITAELKTAYGLTINAKRVLRLMQLLELKALYPKPKLSKAEPKASIYPYLLTGLTEVLVNQVWMVDITYLKLKTTFVYLTAFIDLKSRFITGFHLSSSLDTTACLITLEQALSFAKPQIINSDKGSQFTSKSWIETLTQLNIQISMTGKGRCIDNVFIERFWRTIKYEAFYLNEFDNFDQLYENLKAFIEFYNYKRHHQALNYNKPAELFFSANNSQILS